MLGVSLQYITIMNGLRILKPCVANQCLFIFSAKLLCNCGMGFYLCQFNRSKVGVSSLLAALALFFHPNCCLGTS